MERVKIGVIGGGAIAQIQHLPFLTELADEYDVRVVCDISQKLAEHDARWFKIPSAVNDYRKVLDSDVDAVLLCQTDPKTDVAVDALKAGKHLFIEKPVCFNLREIDSMVSAAKKSGKVAQAGYVKLYEPAFEAAQKEVGSIPDVRFVQVNHLHPGNDQHIRQFRTKKFDDIPQSASDRIRLARKAAIADAIGEVPELVERAFSTLSGSLIHDLYGLRVLFGNPIRISHTEIWQDGRSISTTLEYASGARCVASWVSLPGGLWNFHETLEVYGGAKRVIVKYATGFSRGLSTLTIHGVDEDGRSYQKEPAMEWESPFRRELRHFHASITEGVANRSPLTAARDDIALIIDIIRCYLNKGPIDRKTTKKA
jgi:predicted dehydrogenase